MLNRRTVLATGAIAAVPLSTSLGAMAQSRKDAVTLARDIMALDQDAFSAAFRKSPMKRAKLGGLRRNATVVLSNSGLRDTQQPLGLADDARGVNRQPSQPNLL